MLTRQTGNQSQGLAAGLRKWVMGMMGAGVRAGRKCHAWLGSYWAQLGSDPLAMPSKLLPPHSCCEVPGVAQAPGRAVDLTPPATSSDQNLAPGQGAKLNPDGLVWLGWHGRHPRPTPWPCPGPARDHLLGTQRVCAHPGVVSKLWPQP